MNNHHKKLLAPIIITGIIVLYYGVFFLVCMFMPVPFIGKLFFGLFPLLIIGVCVYVLVERIKEIRSGEEDDLSNY